MPIDDITETLRALKHIKGKEQVCPRCGSSSIVRTSPFDGWLFPARFACERCGYSGYLVLEPDEMEDQSAQRLDVQP